MGAITLKNGLILKYNKLDVDEYWTNTIQIWCGDCLVQTLDRAYISRELVRAILTRDANIINLALEEYANLLETSAERIRTIIRL